MNGKPSGSTVNWWIVFQKFGLELHSGKTRIMEFGRFAAQNRKRRGEGKPETFDFLGFTHICGENAKRQIYNFPAYDKQAHPGQAHIS